MTTDYFNLALKLSRQAAERGGGHQAMSEKLSEKRAAELRSEFESIPAAERDPADVAIGELLADRDAHLADLKEARLALAGQVDPVLAGSLREAIRAELINVMSDDLKEAREIIEYLADFAGDHGLSYAPADAFLERTK